MNSTTLNQNEWQAVKIINYVSKHHLHPSPKEWRSNAYNHRHSPVPFTFGNIQRHRHNKHIDPLRRGADKFRNLHLSSLLLYMLCASSARFSATLLPLALSDPFEMYCCIWSHFIHSLCADLIWNIILLTTIASWAVPSDYVYLIPSSFHPYYNPTLFLSFAPIICRTAVSGGNRRKWARMPSEERKWNQHLIGSLVRWGLAWIYECKVERDGISSDREIVWDFIGCFSGLQ